MFPLKMDQESDGKDMTMGQRYEAIIEETLAKIEFLVYLPTKYFMRVLENMEKMNEGLRPGAMNTEWFMFKKMLKNLFRLEESWRVTSHISTPLTPAKIRTPSSTGRNNTIAAPQSNYANGIIEADLGSINGNDNLRNVIPVDLSSWDNELEKFQDRSEKHLTENLAEKKVYTDSTVIDAVKAIVNFLHSKDSIVKALKSRSLVANMGSEKRHERRARFFYNNILEVLKPKKSAFVSTQDVKKKNQMRASRCEAAIIKLKREEELLFSVVTNKRRMFEEAKEALDKSILEWQNTVDIERNKMLVENQSVCSAEKTRVENASQANKATLEELQKQIGEARERLSSTRQKCLLEKDRKLKKIRVLKMKLLQDVSTYDETMSSKQADVDSVNQELRGIALEKSHLNLSSRKYEYKTKSLEKVCKTLASERFAEEQVWLKKDEGPVKFQKAYRTYRSRGGGSDEKASGKKKK